MKDFYNAPDTIAPVYQDLAPNMCGHPDDVLLDRRLSAQDKRTLLASWASDANAVPHLPTLRQLPNGAIVKVEDILRALKTLDPSGEAADIHRPRKPLWQCSFDRRRGWSLRTSPRNGRGSDNDDDPPPFPAHAAVRPRSGGGGTVANFDSIVA